MSFRVLALGGVLAVASGIVTWHIADALSNSRASEAAVELEIVDSAQIMRLYDSGKLTAITGTDSGSAEVNPGGDLRKSMQAILDQGDSEGVTWCLHPRGYAFPSGYENLLTSKEGKVRVGDNCEVL